LEITKDYRRRRKIVVIYTMGYTKKSAEEFFGLLRKNDIKRLLDIRLHNNSQLSGFTKKADLEYFLREIVGADYYHMEELAPTQEIMDDYRQNNDWSFFEQRFTELLDNRKIAETLHREIFDRPVCLLCSEPKADKCHRRLVAEYLKQNWPAENIRIIHL
jgi:uncharacterized protein (DUF488 family)